MRFHTILFKTVNDLLSLKRNIIFLILVFIAPIILSSIVGMSFDLSNMTLANQVQMVNMFYIILVFFWIAGIMLVMFTTFTCGDFITKEQNDGTLLLLTSKPVQRYEIVLGKYLAFILSMIIYQIIALVITALLMYWLLPVDPYVLDSMASIIPSMILYSTFIAVTFGALATALSCISKSRMKTFIVLIGLTVTVFLGFMLFRGYMVGANVYDPYFSWCDVNYHMGNSYVMILDSNDFRMSPTLQAVLGSVTGTYNAADPGMLYDKDIGAMYPSIERTDYISPIISFIGWLGFTILLLFIGIIRFQKREIT
jgi:ABC-type transport system involved in multi-copper enzyme maturation permease subunit